jgi:2-polyprenyl-3-methyl-5-hydroxy-6-metoxy-1,4-benzoquinol methylase
MNNALESLLECPCCGGKNFTQVIDCKDYTVSNNVFSLVDCGVCGLRFTNPRPGEMDIGAYYKSEEYISHSGTAKGFINRAYLMVRNYTLRGKVRLIESLSPHTESVLDYGAGTGDFLAALKRAGFAVSGIEPSAEARKRAEDIHQIKIDSGVESSGLGVGSFDVITMWHVLEHVHRLSETILDLKSFLKDDGVMLIAVPNCESYDARFYKKFWAAYDVPRHLYHFNQSSMKMFLEKHGLMIVKTLPMYFDSFYVSLLSEKYIAERKKNSAIARAKTLALTMRAFFIGLLSNLMGLSNKKYFSSLIYVVRKK